MAQVESVAPEPNQVLSQPPSKPAPSPAPPVEADTGSYLKSLLETPAKPVATAVLL